MKLSIIIPVYNEEKTISVVLKSVVAITIPQWEIEVIVVDDGSTDNSKQEISKFIKEYKNKKLVPVKEYFHGENKGKAGAIKTGIKNATGNYIIIQDADTEYNPKDIKTLVNGLDSEYNVVYGTRLDRMPDFSRDERNSLFLLHYIGNRLLSFITSILYGKWVTDMETCYKLFPKEAVEKMQLHAKGFAFEPEITAKLLKAHYNIKEIPITTTPRDYAAGKKLQAWKDGPIAMWTLVKYRFIN